MVSGMNNTTTISHAFGKSVRWQIIATVLVAALAFSLAGWHGALSAMGGGVSVIVGGFVAVALTRGKKPSTPGSALLVVLKAEAIKIAVIALVLLAIFKLYRGLVPLALIGGLACAALISGAALRALDEENNR
jgi:ATP synthase protein I